MAERLCYGYMMETDLGETPCTKPCELEPVLRELVTDCALYVEAYEKAQESQRPPECISWPNPEHYFVEALAAAEAALKEATNAE